MAEAVTQPGAERSSRQDVINEIERKRVEHLNEELKEGGGEEIEFSPTDLSSAKPEDTDTEKAVEDPPAGEAPAQVAPAQDIYEFLGEDKLGTTKAKIKVDGKDEEVVIGELLRDVQKFRAADRRLEEASLAKKQAQADAQAAAEIKAKAQAEADEIRKNAGETPPKDGSPPETPDAIKKALTLVYEGDIDQAASSLNDVVTAEVEKRVKQHATPQDTRSLVRSVRSEIAWDSTLEKFAGDHPEITQDPFLMGIWQNHLNQEIDRAGSEGRAVNPEDVVGGATAATTAWLDKVSGGKPAAAGAGLTVDAETLAQRKAGKQAAAGHVVTGSTTTRSPAAQQPTQPPTASDIIMEMKRNRGQL